MFFFHSLLVWGAVILITALSYATGLRGDESGTASNSTIEKAFDAGPGGALSLFLTTVVLAPLLEGGGWFIDGALTGTGQCCLMKNTS